MRVSQGSGLPGRTGTTKRGNRLTGDLIVYAGLFPWTNNILYIIDDLYREPRSPWARDESCGVVRLCKISNSRTGAWYHQRQIVITNTNLINLEAAHASFFCIGEDLRK